MNYKVITLLGQNVNSYHSSLDGKDVDFADLMQMICDIEDDFELRFMSSHPKDLTSKVIDTIARNPKISRYIHLPVQSGSTKILKAMNRNYTREKYLALIDEIKQKIPNVILTTDIIVGFPGETDQDYMDTVELLKQVRYSNAYIFMYSKRRGTPAEKMDNQVPLETKKARIHNLLKIEHEISNEIFTGLVGTTQRVLVQDITDTDIVAKLQCGKIVKLPLDTQLSIGQFVDVNITDYKNGDLLAKI
jgi:tRNA-2-methylthio-N6-dimethylallyladenosine synthase